MLPITACPAGVDRVLSGRTMTHTGFTVEYQLGRSSVIFDNDVLLFAVWNVHIADLGAQWLVYM
jgi:hypothetical protein